MEAEKRKPWMIRNMSEQAIREIKAQAAREGRSVRDVLQDAISMYLRQKEKRSK